MSRDTERTDLSAAWVRMVKYVITFVRPNNPPPFFYGHCEREKKKKKTRTNKHKWVKLSADFLSEPGHTEYMCNEAKFQRIVFL